MIKNKTILEVKTGDRDYQLTLDPVSPLGEIFDALSQMQSFIIQKINESQPKKEDVKEDPKVEVLPQE